MINYGHPLKEAHIRINGPGTTFDATGRDVVQLKPGTYSIVVDVPGFDTFRSPVTIDQREQTLSIGMRLGPYEGAQVNCSVDGRVHPNQDGIRVRLVSMFGLEVRDTPLSKGGVFHFDRLECGSYMLVALRSAECVGLAFPVVTARATVVHLPILKTCNLTSIPGEK